MQDLVTYGMLLFLGLGAIGLCASLVQLLCASIRPRRPRASLDRAKFREMVASTRSSLMELETLLSSEVVETTARHAATVTLSGRPQVELFQKIRKYQAARSEAAWGGQH
jgi:hypothetical protein